MPQHLARQLGAAFGLRHREAESLGASELLARDAAIRAAALGHHLSPWERDTFSSRVASCSVCLGFAVVDYEEQPMTYGRATTEPCRSVA